MLKLSLPWDLLLDWIVTFFIVWTWVLPTRCLLKCILAYHFYTCVFRGPRLRSGYSAVLQIGRFPHSFPDGVIGIFHWHNPSDRTMALGLTQPLTEMSTREISWGRCVGLTTLPPPYAVVMKSGNLNFLEPSGPLQACNGTDLSFYLHQETAILIKNFVEFWQFSRLMFFTEVPI